MKKFLLIALALGTGLFAQKLTIQGSTTVLPIAQAAAEAYMDNNPDADITVRGGGSGTGIAALIDGATDIADASRPMKDKEIKQAREKGVGLAYAYHWILSPNPLLIISRLPKRMGKYPICHSPRTGTSRARGWTGRRAASPRRPRASSRGSPRRDARAGSSPPTGSPGSARR